MTRWANYLTLGNFLKPLAQIILPKSPTFWGNFCKGVKIYHFSSEIIFGQLLQTFGDFFLVALILVRLRACLFVFPSAFTFMRACLHYIVVVVFKFRHFSLICQISFLSLSLSLSNFHSCRHFSFRVAPFRERAHPQIPRCLGTSGRDRNLTETQEDGRRNFFRLETPNCEFWSKKESISPKLNRSETGSKPVFCTFGTACNFWSSKGIQFWADLLRT